LEKTLEKLPLAAIIGSNITAWLSPFPVNLKRWNVLLLLCHDHYAEKKKTWKMLFRINYMYISTEEEEEIWGAPVTITGATTGK
jgi:hypothetical protein